MTDPKTRRHGLQSLVAAASAVHSGKNIEIRIQSDLGHINVRGDSRDTRFVSAVETVLGQNLPLEPNTSSLTKHRVYWLGPDEWLILTGINETAALTEALQKSADGVNVAVNDLSGGQVALALSGANVREVFAKGCTLDFHPRVFTAGMCAQSGLAKASVFFALTGEADTFDVIVRRSFADYLVRWLMYAADEYGVRIESE